jgi:D-cysteine desulfhydrase family pyridoxal phosphate-dependent enzyme
MTSVEQFARVRLGHYPTPIEPLRQLSQTLAGPEIWVKRDDCSGLGFGGNMVRKLEYLIAEALAEGADTIITTGGPQSNHARQTAAAAARCGLGCLLVLVDSVQGRHQAYYSNGNIMLDRLFGAEVEILPAGTDATAAMAVMTERCRSRGRKPYVIPVGGSSATGILGHVEAANELLVQSETLGVAFDRVVVASGSGGTHAGLAIGLAKRKVHTALAGYCVSRSAAEQRSKIAALIEPACAKLGISPPLNASDLILEEGVLGDGYGQPTPAMREAVGMVAKLEGLVLDPVYTGKAMAGLIADIRRGRIDRSERVLFMHTGGAMALFAYPEVFAGDV